MKPLDDDFCHSAILYLDASCSEIRTRFRIIVALTAVWVVLCVWLKFYNIPWGLALLGAGVITASIFLNSLYRIPGWFRSWVALHPQDADARSLTDAFAHGRCKTYQETLKWLDLRISQKR